ncbi:MAG: response regulator transcription factor [Bacteroidetes bacterium]|nr:response regulator transcription factor [Bacteroidota bacterium]
MNPLRIVIIEDEPATARNLHFMLREIDVQTELLATLDSVTQSTGWLVDHPNDYDLIFMDIRLSDGLSFEIFNRVQVSRPVIFVTAYDDYALQAFKTSGIDYILKPFDKADLRKALNKFRQLRGMQQTNDMLQQLPAIAGQLQTGYKGYKQSFLVHFRDRLLPVAARDIAIFYTLNETSYAQCFDNRRFPVEFTLEQLQEQLDPQSFFRANRQFIVQRSAISEVGFYFNRRLLLRTTPAPDENIIISKARVPEFRAWMNS